MFEIYANCFLMSNKKKDFKNCIKMFWSEIRFLIVQIKSTISNWFERIYSHIATETRSKLLREAAVRNIGQYTKV